MSFPPVVAPVILGWSQYAPAARTLLTVTGEVLTAFSPGPASLSFVAPAGPVLLHAAGSFAVTTSSLGNLGWLLHDTATQLGITHTWQNGWGTSDYNSLVFEQVVEGLIAGESYELDLAGANGTSSADTVVIACQGAAGVVTTSTDGGGPLVLSAVAL